MKQKFRDLIIYSFVFYFVFNLSAMICSDAFEVEANHKSEIEDERSQYYPFYKGLTWTYEGNIKWTDIDTNEIKEESVNWETKVIDAFESGQNRIAILEGFPSDLIWSNEGEDTAKQYTLIVKKDDEYYLVYGEDLSTWQDSSEIELDLEQDGIKLITNPLEDNQQIITENEFVRNVYKKDNFKLGNLEQDLTAYQKASYEINMSTGPDHEIFHFSPSLGITHYEYEHHGTVMEVELNLTGMSD